MKSETKKTLLFITSILSVLSLFLSYYEIYRYFSIYIFNLDRYKLKYEKLEKVKKTVIIMYKNDDKSDETLKSILDQTIGVEEIIVYGTKDTEKYKKLGIKTSQKQSENGDCMIIYDSVKKYDNDTIIISIIDGVIYGKDFIRVLLDSINENPNTLIKTPHAMAFKPDYFGTDIDVKEPLKYVNVGTKNLSYNLNYKVI